MAEARNHYTDGEAYERQMGRWSRVAGEIFLDWLSLPKGLRWLDVGCGTGPFTGLIVDRSEPSAISAVDPADDQIAYARERPWGDRVDFHQGAAEALPFGDDEFDAAVMALVVTHLSDRGKGIAEMKRVVGPGGTVAAYVWDRPGHPQEPLIDALDTMGLERGRLRGHQDAEIDMLTDLFDASNLDGIASCPIEIQVTFKDFDDYWTSQTQLANRFVRAVRAMAANQLEQLKASLREQLSTDGDDRIAYMARASAVKGRVPE